ncbi:MAG: hypothetical protein R3298_09065 [Gammaproteobacteria bacterium]|nr:hypothetical protein [Gammaproteobacteria bacterium]
MRRYTRHDEVPVFERREATLDANRYNRACLVRKHAPGGRLRLALPTLRHLDLILQEDAWIVVDRDLGDIPLLAWSGFEVDPEERLHRPVACGLRLYHAQAGLLLGRVLEELAGLLDAWLVEADGDRGRVLDFPGEG